MYKIKHNKLWSSISNKSNVKVWNLRKKIDVEKKTIKIISILWGGAKKNKKTRVNWINLLNRQHESWDQDNIIENKPK
jgi:hypothetical protein